jgi:hypothetical protein
MYEATTYNKPLIYNKATFIYTIRTHVMYEATTYNKPLIYNKATFIYTIRTHVIYEATIYTPQNNFFLHYTSARDV